MNIEALTPEQVVRVVILGGIILSLFGLGVLSFIYWMHRIATKQRFSVAVGPLATVGLIDCLLAIGLLVFLVVSAPVIAVQIFPKLKADLISTEGDSSDSSDEEEEKPADAVDGNSLSADFTRPVYFRSVKSDATGVANAPGSDPSGALLEPLKSLDASKAADVAKQNGGTTADPLDGLLNGKSSENETSAPTESDPSKSGATANTKISAGSVILSGIGATMQLVAVAWIFGFIKLRTGCSAKQLGISFDNFWRDVGVGLWVLFLVIPVLLVFSGIVNYYTQVEYNHPVINMMNQHPWLIGVIAWMAVIVAPISEEFLFRTMLIGFFESIHFGRTKESFWMGWLPRSARNDDANNETSSFVGQQSTSNVSNPYEPSLDRSNSSRIVNLEHNFGDGNYSPPWWPAVVSGTLFGLAHFSYGMSWIPLVFFGIVLGRVYQLRQSLVTCIAIHMAFNAINLLNLWLSIGLPRDM